MFNKLIKGYNFEVSDTRYDDEYNEKFDQYECYDKKMKAYNYDHADNDDWGDEELWKGWI